MTRKLKKSLATLCLAACLLALCPARAAAWGGKGHRVVAHIAWDKLAGTRALDEVKAILGSDRAAFLDASTWPDTVRFPGSAFSYADNWHFVSIPRTSLAYNQPTQCKRKVTVPNTGGRQVNDCVVGALDYAASVLRDPASTRQRKAVALKFIVHFVGDMHQPLHTSEDTQFKNHKGAKGDRGGNYRFVCFLGKCRQSGKNLNLHSTWDTYMIVHRMMLDGIADEEAYADAVTGALPQLFDAGELSAIAQGTPDEWATEAHLVARGFVYRLPPAKWKVGAGGQMFKFSDVTKDYYDENIGRVDRQLARGGHRLAEFLKQIFHE